MSDIGFKLGEFRMGNNYITGLVLGDAIIDLKRAGVLANGLPAFGDLQDLLQDWDRNFDRLCAVTDFVRSEGIRPVGRMGDNSLDPRPPIKRPGRMLYAAANYRDHVTNIQRTFASALPPPGEQKAKLRPYLFAKVCSQTGAFDDIVLPKNIARVDWEAELAVVIGKQGRYIPAEKVGDYIAGYMTTNDVSCRDLTWREDRPSIRSDWISGKSFDSFAPMGPFLTPKAFVPDHANLSIRLWVNGEIKQDGNSRDMTFGIEDQLAYAARMITLEPGDVFATGTPAGTGQERLEFLKSGDVVETEVEHCGRQRNRVVAESVDS